MSAPPFVLFQQSSGAGVLDAFVPPAVTVKVDWDNDGLFANAYSDISCDIVSGSCKRGRDHASMVDGRAAAGRFSALLRNDDGRYSPFNEDSPLFDLILPGRRIVVYESDGVTSRLIWCGFLDAPEPDAALGKMPDATLTGSGALSLLQQQEVSLPTAENQLVSTLITTVLDVAGWPPTARLIDTADYTTGRYIEKEDISALDALRHLEDTEPLGFLYEGLDEDPPIVFERGSYRQEETRCTVSQASYSDNAADVAAGAIGYRAVGHNDPFESIINRVVTTVRQWGLGASAVVWTSPFLPVTIGVGTTTFYAAINPDDGPVDTWVIPTVGTDITATNPADEAGLFVFVLSASATAYSFAVINSNAGAVELDLVQLRGQRITEVDSIKVVTEDTDSQAKYNAIKTYQFSPAFLASQAQAAAHAAFILARYKDKLPVVKVEIVARDVTHAQEQMRRAIGDRITLKATGTRTKLGIDRDFWVESIEHSFGPRGAIHRTVYDLSPTQFIAGGGGGGEEEGSDTTGAVTPATWANDASYGAESWSNPTNATSSNDSRATVSLGRVATSNYLKGTNLGLSVPGTATLVRAIIRVERSYSGAPVRDASLRLLRLGVPWGTDLADLATLWPSTDTVATYTIDISSLTPAIVNANDFGIVIACADPAASSSAVGRVDTATIEVEYNP